MPAPPPGAAREWDEVVEREGRGGPSHDDDKHDSDDDLDGGEMMPVFDF